MGSLKQSTTVTFWALTGAFFVVLCQFFIPAFGDLFEGSELLLVPMAIFCLLGLALLVLSIREKVGGTLKKFLILTGASAIGFFVFVVLHNAFYALNTITGEIFILNYLVEGLSAIFFLTAIFVCPIGFLVGAIGTIILLMKENR